MGTAAGAASTRSALILTCCLSAAAWAAEEPAPGAAPGGDVVYVIRIEDGPQVARGMVDPWQSFFVARHVEAAKEARAVAIVFQITTYGGMVDAANEIASTITSVKSIPTIAFVVDRALSAGAQIAIACDKIYMQEGSQIGSAQIIGVDAEGGQKALGEKYDSYMRSRFKTLAQQKSRNTALAQAMTDPELVVLRIEVDGEEDFVLERDLTGLQIDMDKQGKRVEITDTVVQKGELLNMTYEDALEKFHFIDGVVSDRQELFVKAGLAGAKIVEPRASWPQEVARFVGGPVISGLLLSLAMLGLMMELWSPGKGIGGLVFLFGMGLFFWAHFLGGQAGAVEIVLFLLGVVLLALEAFVIPGFGAAGISGMALVFLSLVMSFIPDVGAVPGLEAPPFDWGGAAVAIFTVLASFGGSIVALLVLTRLILRVPPFRGLTLAGATAGGGTAGLPAGADAAGPAELAGLAGKRGVVRTDLRPAGKIEIEGELVDAVTQAEFIEKGRSVRVLEVKGFRVVVALDSRPASGGGGEA